MSSFGYKHPSVSHIGHNVSHAKNRTRRAFRHNLHTVTLVIEGVKEKWRVTTKQLRQLKATGKTTHFKKTAKI